MSPFGCFLGTTNSESKKWNSSYFPSTLFGFPTFANGLPIRPDASARNLKEVLELPRETFFSLFIIYVISTLCISTNNTCHLNRCTFSPSPQHHCSWHPRQGPTLSPPQFLTPVDVLASRLHPALSLPQCPACLSCLSLHPSSLTTQFLFGFIIFACAVPSFWNAFLPTSSSFKPQLSHPQSSPRTALPPVYFIAHLLLLGWILHRHILVWVPPSVWAHWGERILYICILAPRGSSVSAFRIHRLQKQANTFCLWEMQTKAGNRKVCSLTWHPTSTLYVAVPGISNVKPEQSIHF